MAGLHAATGRPGTSRAAGSAGEALVGGPRAARREGAALRSGRAGRAGRRADRPGRTAPPGRRPAGTPPTAHRRRGAAGAAKTSPAGPASTTRPAYITVIRSHRSAEHREVVADHHHPDPAVADQVGEHVEHLRLHHHVERRGRLVGHDQLGVAGQRHRDHHPLLLAAGELVGVAAGAVGVEADLLEQLADPRGAPLASRRAPVRCSSIGSAIWSPIRCTGLSECSAPWKTIDAPGPAHRAQVAPAHRQHVVARRTAPRR